MDWQILPDFSLVNRRFMIGFHEFFLFKGFDSSYSTNDLILNMNPEKQDNFRAEKTLVCRLNSTKTWATFLKLKALIDLEKFQVIVFGIVQKG